MILLKSCSGAVGENPDATSYFLSDNYSIQDKIKTMLQDENLDVFGYSEDEKLWLRDFYAKRKFSPLWVNDSCLTERGLELQTAVAHSLWFGIPENRLKKPKFDTEIFVRDEILLTANAAFLSLIHI
jgi:hypothetical protein